MNTDNRLGRIKYDFKSGGETYTPNPNFGKPLPPKPLLVEKFTDNGEHSHWSLVNSENGEMLWSEAPEEELPCNRPQQFADLKAEIERLKGEKSDAVDFIVWVRGNATPAQYCTWIYKGKSRLSSGELYDIFKSTK